MKNKKKTLLIPASALLAMSLGSLTGCNKPVADTTQTLDSQVGIRF